MKKHIISAVFFTSILFFCHNTAHAQWQQLNVQIPAYNTDVFAITAFNGNLVAESGNGGLFVSSDNGTHWDIADSNIDGNISCFALLGKYLYTGNGGVSTYISAHDGFHLTPTNIGIDDVGVSCLTILNGTIIAGGADGVYISRDSGITWAHDTIGMLPYSGIYSLATIGNDIFASSYIFYRANRQILYRSSDGGVTWMEADSGLPTVPSPNGFEVFAVNNMLYCAWHDSIGLYISADSGKHWTPRNNGLPSYWSFPAYATLGNYIFIAQSYDSLYRSSDGGANWSAMQNFPSNASIEALYVNAGVLFVGTKDGVFSSPDSGNSWNYASGGLLDWDANMFMVNDSVLLAGAQLYDAFYHQPTDGVLLHSTNAGESWDTGTNGIVPSYNPPSFASVGKDIFASTDGGIYRSTDNGMNWDTVGYPEEITGIVSNGTNIFAGVISWIMEFGIIRSTDRGTSWIPVDSGVVESIYHGLLTSCNGNVFVAMQDQCNVYRTTNNGEYWTNADSGMPKYPNGGDSAVTAFGVMGDTIFAVIGNGSIYRSTNNGDLWEPFATIGFPANVIINTLFAHSGVLFAGTCTGFYYSLDHGSSWISGSEGLPSGASVGTLSATNEYLYAGISNGIYRRPLSDFGINAVNEKRTTLPAQLSLSQNYPNPFSGETTISYSLSTPERVTLTVYNSLGEEVATLVSDKQSAGGHNVVFKSDQLQNGMYFYRIVAGMDVQSGKMIVLKK